jgi:hypothetical protein
MQEFLAKNFSLGATFAQIIWALIMAGVGRIILWFFEVVPRRGERVYWIAAPFTFLLAMAAFQYASWSLGPRPDLRVSVVTANVAPVPNKPHNTLMVLEVVVLNAGTPSIVEEWGVSVGIGGQKPVQADLLNVPKVMHLSGEVGTNQYFGEDALYKKTVEQPIPSGGRVAGILMCEIENVSPDIVRRPGTQIILGYSDVRGQKYVFSVAMSGIEGAPRYLPGLRSLEGEGTERENK